VKYLMAFALGVIYVFGFAPFNFWPATLFSIAGLYLLLQAPGVRPLWVAWIFGLGKYGLGASWVYVSIHVYGGAPPLLAGALVIMFVAGIALLFSLPVALIYLRLKAFSDSIFLDVLSFVAAWMFVDWLSTWLFTGFPWLLPGYALLDTFVAPAAAVVGGFGLGLLVVIVAAALAAALWHRAWPPVLLALVPVSLAASGSFWVWVTPTERVEVALVQGNIDQAIKWQRDQAQPNLDQHLRLSADHWDADVVMWPEAAITHPPQQAQAVLEELAQHALATRTNFILGVPGLVPRPEGGYAFQNLAVGLGQARGRFAKHHLVPFGEYVPLEGLLRGLIGFFDLPMSTTVAGQAEQSNIQMSVGAAAMAICYEIVYPESMRQRARTAGLLMTISNDTWFGDSLGPLQHLQIARMRALENGRWLLRATNNGVTAIVDHQGALVAQLPQFTEGVLRGQAWIMQGRTPFSRLGHWPVLIAMGALLLWLLRRRHFA